MCILAQGKREKAREYLEKLDQLPGERSEFVRGQMQRVKEFLGR